jgi:guanosine-3',5'-bis(diphosphate) 3'-pyrophosphohydrolase
MLATIERAEEVVARSRAFALEAHDYDQRPARRSRAQHLHRVQQVLERYEVHDPVLRAAGWLHDTVEDTPVRIEDIRYVFGSAIAAIVEALTDEPGSNRAQKQRRTFPKIQSTPGALVVKLGDRLANVEYALESRNRSLLNMYVREHDLFRDCLFTNEHAEMWASLEEAIQEASQAAHLLVA